MKKIFISLLTTVLLAGCFGSGPAEDEQTITDIDSAGSASLADTPDLENIDAGKNAKTVEDSGAEALNNEEVELTEDLFVIMSAQILCLPTEYPEADPEEIEAKAQAVLAGFGVTEARFTELQNSIAEDEEKKVALSNEIIANMDNFCGFSTEEEGAKEENETTTEGSEN